MPFCDAQAFHRRGRCFVALVSCFPRRHLRPPHLSAVACIIGLAYSTSLLSWLSEDLFQEAVSPMRCAHNLWAVASAGVLGGPSVRPSPATESQQPSGSQQISGQMPPWSRMPAAPATAEAPQPSSQASSTSPRRPAASCPPHGCKVGCSLWLPNLCYAVPASGRTRPRSRRQRRLLGRPAEWTDLPECTVHPGPRPAAAA